MCSSSPLILVIHRLGEYPFGFDGVLIGFDLTFVMRVSKSSDFRIINNAAFRYHVIKRGITLTWRSPEVEQGRLLASNAYISCLSCATKITTIRVL